MITSGIENKKIANNGRALDGNPLTNENRRNKKPADNRTRHDWHAPGQDGTYHMQTHHVRFRESPIKGKQKP